MNSLKVVLSLSLIILSQNLLSQSFTTLTRNEFRSIQLDDKVSIGELIDEKNYESKLESLFGQPVDKECYRNPITEYACNIEYFGFTLKFDYGDFVYEIHLDQGNRFLNYNGSSLRTGMSLFQLNTIFSQSYQNRYSVVKDNGANEVHIVKVEVETQGDDYNAILFYYNPDSNLVTQISVIFPVEV